MAAVVYIAELMAALCWMNSAGSALDLLLNHRGDDRSLSSSAAHGYLFFDAENFAPSGAASHSRFQKGLAGFVVCVAVVALMMAFTAS